LPVSQNRLSFASLLLAWCHPRHYQLDSVLRMEHTDVPSAGPAADRETTLDHGSMAPFDGICPTDFHRISLGVLACCGMLASSLHDPPLDLLPRTPDHAGAV